MTVHNHGTEEGEGLACPETRLPGGRLVGRCLMTIRSEGIHNPGTDMAPVNFQLRAMELVKNEIDSHYMPATAPPVYELYVVWFAKVLDNWKALISTDMLDGSYYEVTHNGAKQETYIDVYGKRVNIVVPD